jgi:hypothetical protein
MNSVIHPRYFRMNQIVIGSEAASERPFFWNPCACPDERDFRTVACRRRKIPTRESRTKRWRRSAQRPHEIPGYGTTYQDVGTSKNLQVCNYLTELYSALSKWVVWPEWHLPEIPTFLERIRTGCVNMAIVIGLL